MMVWIAERREAATEEGQRSPRVGGEERWYWYSGWQQNRGQ